VSSLATAFCADDEVSRCHGELDLAGLESWQRDAYDVPIVALEDLGSRPAQFTLRGQPVIQRPPRTEVACREQLECTLLHTLLDSVRLFECGQCALVRVFDSMDMNVRHEILLKRIGPADRCLDADSGS
jgi:hypothetical protein